MMFDFDDIDTYFDGGTIGITGKMNDCSEIDNSMSPIITIDYSIRTDTPGSWYNGWKSKGGKLITDKTIISEVLSKIEFKVGLMTHCLNRAKQSLV